MQIYTFLMKKANIYRINMQELTKLKHKYTILHRYTSAGTEASYSFGRAVKNIGQTARSHLPLSNLFTRFQCLVELSVFLHLLQGIVVGMEHRCLVSSHLGKTEAYRVVSLVLADLH